MPKEIKTRRSSQSKISQMNEKERKQERVGNGSRRKSLRRSQDENMLPSESCFIEEREAKDLNLEPQISIKQGFTNETYKGKCFFEQMVAKEKITDLLSIDLSEKMCRIKDNVEEVLLKPSAASESFVTQVVQKLCNVMHSNTNQFWSGTSLLKLSSGNSDLTYWKLSSSSVASEYCYIFGISINSTWKYLTHQGSGNPVKFLTHDTAPEDIDTDNKGETSDYRTFYFRRGGYFIAASDTSLALQLDGGIVKADDVNSVTDTWELIES